MSLNLVRGGAAPATGESGPGDTLLVTRLAEALDRAQIRYCQWKGSGKHARWLAGHGDIDLLIDRTSASAFADQVEQLGFKLALPDRQLPGVVSYLGLDSGLGRLIHIHAHFCLILGRSWTRHYHVAIERAVLDTSQRGPVFRTPAPEFELILFVIQQTLKSRPFGRGADYQPELDRLTESADRTEIGRALTRHLPTVNPVLFDKCLEALSPDARPRERLVARARLQRVLSPHLHRTPRVALWRRVTAKMDRVLGLRPPEITGKRLAGGGAVIALLGADGSGKSTAAKTLVKWLGGELRTRRIHMGLPPRSLATMAVGGLLKVSRWIDARLGRTVPSDLSSHLELLRCVGTARDRYGLYRGVRRFAASGGLAICERYPVPENYALAGPSSTHGVALQASSPFAAMLRRIETRYYARITSPDLLLVLRVEPETAVRRKTDEPAAYVRARARIVRDTDWSGRPVQLIDAEQPLPLVLEQLRAAIWEAL